MDALTVNRDPLADVLREQKILSAEETDHLIAQHEQTGRGLVQLIREQKLLSEEQIIRLTAQSCGIEFVELTPEMIDPVALKLVSLETAQKHRLIPMRIEKDTLVVAMSSPLNLPVSDMITMRTGYKVRPVAASTDAIARAIRHHFNIENMTRQDIVQMRLRHKGEAANGKSVKTRAIRAADAPVVRLVESIFTGAIEAHASDIHLEPQQPDMRVRYRIDGLLSEALAVPTSAQEEVISHIKILADMDISERRLPQDGHITLDHDGRFYDLRVSTLPASGGEKIVIRILDAANGLQKLDEIVQSDADKKAFTSLIANPYGMILLTGPTGCGKTTTLYSMLQILNTAERNIVTVEDPVEYQLRGITQVQVKPEINITFASTLRSVLRQDPNVILIGEIRDEETAEIAVSASLTGHLVLSTLHANTAAGAVLRLLNLEIPAYQAAAALLGAASQRLLRSICQQCKTAYQPSQEEMDILGVEGQSIEQLYRGTGCDNCRGTGYSGRMAVYELMAVVPEVRALIAEAAPEDAIKAAAVRNGMKTLRMSAAEQVIAGRTTLSEMMRAIDIREK